MTTRNWQRLAATAAALFLTSGCLAQSARTEHTLKLDDGVSSPPATLADASWLVGSWSGPAFGGHAEEAWNPPSAGSMVGFFKLIQDGEVSFYELLVLVEENDSLSLKVKHFSRDFKAWEEADDYVDFRLVRIDEDALHFSGLSFYRISDDLLHVYIAMRSGDKVREEKLIYHRTAMQ